MASIPCTIQLSTSRTATSRRWPPRMRTQQKQEDKGGAAGGLRTPLLLGASAGDVRTVISSPVPHEDAAAGKPKKIGNLLSAEAVDVSVKRSNPSSSRLGKFGFPKLPELAEGSASSSVLTTTSSSGEQYLAFAKVCTLEDGAGCQLLVV